MSGTKRKSGNPNWVKGGPSPNPGGRGKLADELRQRALKAVDQRVLEAWEDEMEVRERQVITQVGPITVVARGPNWVKCSELLAAYGLGKPVQPTESKVDVVHHDAREMSRERLLAIAAGTESVTEH